MTNLGKLFIKNSIKDSKNIIHKTNVFFVLFFFRIFMVLEGNWIISINCFAFFFAQMNRYRNILIEIGKFIFENWIEMRYWPSLYCLFVFLFVCLYPIKVKTAEKIWPKDCKDIGIRQFEFVTNTQFLFRGTSLDPREGLWMIEFSKIFH